MENEFTEEELEAIRVSDEMLKEIQYEDQQQKKFHPNEIKINTNINERKLIKRSFKIKLVPALGTILISAALISGSLIASNKYKQIRSTMLLKAEIEMHGGKKDINTDKYIWDLNKHIESGKCAIPKEQDLTIEDRIEKYCKNNGLSDEITDAAITKFNLYYSNHMEEAEKIDLVQMLRKEQKLLEEEKNSYNK